MYEEYEGIYLDKHQRSQIRAKKSSEVNRREIKLSQQSDVQKQRRRNQMRRDLKKGGVNYSQHMSWLKD
ncbi:hypothetical protein H7198_01695 [Fructobacillus sp. CRL 2054]|uniref:hypothetical protein n=1 Tax=Fructobacillus sp. CRL 2054 TaxID=2763007 RepID=UPI00237800D0|nr:hypothetical protein [Fructobacillus sp. CRL 2054]MDD9138326.1 hypothetical protein [Fructobacillus sp. CRL 2054]